MTMMLLDGEVKLSRTKALGSKQQLHHNRATMAELASTIRETSKRPSQEAVEANVRAYLNATYPDLASLAGPSKSTGRTLNEDVAYWFAQEADARAKLQAAESALPGTIEGARTALSRVLDRAQALTLERYRLSDEVGKLMAELDSAVRFDDDDDEMREAEGGRGGKGRREATLLERVEAIHASIARSKAALAWASVLERVLVQR